MLALTALAVYLLIPAPAGMLTALVVAIFAFYSIFVLVRDSVETSVYPLTLLILDLLFFLICALHPSREGLWLSTLAYFFLLAMASLMYSWKNTAGVVALSLLFFLVVQPQPAYSLWPTVVLGGVLAILLSIHRSGLQQRLSTALKRSVISRYEAESARESERQRIAADFHDGPLQSFISFQMRLEIIRKLMGRDAESALRELEQLQELGKSQVVELRSFIRNMQPIEVDQAGLQASIREIIHTFQRDSGIQVNLAANDIVEPGDPDVATEVLQVVREALNNVRKHSKASRAAVSVQQQDHTIEITVEDDGSGFPFSGAWTLDELELLRLGPRSIRRRVRTLGGEMLLDSRPSQGAELRIRIPV